MKFGTMTKLDPKAIRYLVIHHSASHDVSAETIHQWHLNKGWSGIGYHYVVRQNGTIEKGRDEQYQGAHAVPVNSQSIGICCTGDFTKEKMSEAQKNALIKLLKELKSRYPLAAVTRHKDVDKTACPGNIPFIEIQQAVLQVNAWNQDAEIQQLIDSGIINTPRKPQDVVTWGEFATVLNRLRR